MPRKCVRRYRRVTDRCAWCGADVSGEGAWPPVGPPWPICCECGAEDPDREFGPTAPEQRDAE